MVVQVNSRKSEKKTVQWKSIHMKLNQNDPLEQVDSAFILYIVKNG